MLFDSSRTAMHRTLLKIRTLLKAHSIVMPSTATPPSQPSRLGFEPGAATPAA
ncbi:hypothetical protein ACFY1C_23000 [Streptomyces sp. NPDC001279]|uniref:hypothetical protein n=1 Tax=Streptomyces sp. NPDC001279 TaxID=3364556 RepID=UPI0036A20C48